MEISRGIGNLTYTKLNSYIVFSYEIEQIVMELNGMCIRSTSSL